MPHVDAQAKQKQSPRPVSGRAAGAAVLGMAALAASMLGPLFSVPLAIAAVIVAVRARRELKASDGELGGYGFSLTGFLLGGGLLAYVLLSYGLPYLYMAVFFIFR